MLPHKLHTEQQTYMQIISLPRWYNTIYTNKISLWMNSQILAANMPQIYRALYLAKILRLKLQSESEGMEWILIELSVRVLFKKMFLVIQVPVWSHFPQKYFDSGSWFITISRPRINPRPSKAMASNALRNGLDSLPNICTLKAKNKCPFFLVALVPCGNPVYVPHWKVVVTIGALFEWPGPWMPPPPKKKVNTSCPFLKLKVPFLKMALPLWILNSRPAISMFIKGSLDTLTSTPDHHAISSVDCFWQQKNTCTPKVLELKNLQLRNKHKLV